MGGQRFNEGKLFRIYDGEHRKLQGVVLRRVQSWVYYIRAKFHNVYFANANICFLSRSVQFKSLNPRNMFKEKICMFN